MHDFENLCFEGLNVLYMSEVGHTPLEQGVKCLAQGHIGDSQWI